jgi:hypothetical protein
MLEARKSFLLTCTQFRNFCPWTTKLLSSRLRLSFRLHLQGVDYADRASSLN